MGTHEEMVERRGVHEIVFEEGDLPEQLKAAQPHLTWGVVPSGTDSLACLPYAEFAGIIGHVLWVEGLGFPGKGFLTSTVGEACLDRSWKTIILGIVDWSPCRPCDFGGRVRAAARNSLVSRSELKLLPGDFYEIPTFGFASGEPLEDLAWAQHLTFSPGALADTTDGILSVWAELEYHSEARFPVAARRP